MHLFICLILASTYSYASLNSSRHNEERDGMVKGAENWVNPASAFRALTHLSENGCVICHQISHPVFTILPFGKIKTKTVH